MNQIRKFALGAVSACAMAMTPMVSDAANIQLGFVLDGSGSIGSASWTTITTGLATAINLIPFGGTDTYEVSVVQFGTNAVTYGAASNIVINSAATRSTLATFISGLAQVASNTNYQAGFAAMQGVLGNTIRNANFSYVNFATDGEPNTCGFPVGVGATEAAGRACGTAAAAALVASGVDNISIEGIGVSASNATFLQNNICYPQPCDTSIPFAFPGQGFYIGVANAAEYAVAIQNKVRIVTNTPEPASLALVGLALAGLGLSRRRKASTPT